MNPAARLDEELGAMQALRDLLQQEQAALSVADASACEALLSHKAALVAQLATLAAERHQALGDVGQAPNEHGMREWLKQATEASDTHEALAPWEALILTTREARALNQTNGALLLQLRANNQLALQSLRGHRETDGYDPGGQPHPVRHSRARAIG